MEKKRLFKILGRASASEVARLCEDIKQQNSITVIKTPSKTLSMIQMREPVKESLFYLGEVIVWEAMVEIGGAKGMAVLMGDEEEKTLNAAIIDAAINRGIFTREEELIALERTQEDFIRRENAMHLKTMVNFESMDGEVKQ